MLEEIGPSLFPAVLPITNIFCRKPIIQQFSKTAPTTQPPSTKFDKLINPLCNK